MNQKLFTQEGKEYIVKVANGALTSGGTLDVVFAGDHTFVKQVYVNSIGSINITSPGATNYGGLVINTTKPIIPISYNVSAIDNATQLVTVDVSNCYFMARQTATFEVIPNYLSALNKISPYVERIYYTSENNNNFISRYNQVILSDNDFLATADNINIIMLSSLSYANTGINSTLNFPVIPAGSYRMRVSFTYLELQ